MFFLKRVKVYTISETKEQYLDFFSTLTLLRSVLQIKLSIKEISQEVGFAYPRYFSTTFKQIKGMTPTQFKESGA